MDGQEEKAGQKAIQEKRIGGAGFDAFAEEPPNATLPVYQLPNMCVQSHTAVGTDGTSRKRAVFARENLARYARDEEIAASVS